MTEEQNDIEKPAKDDQSPTVSNEETSTTEEAAFDISQFSTKKELATEYLRRAESNENFVNDKPLQQLFDAYLGLVKAEKNEAKEKFLEDGGEEDAFEFKGDPEDDKFIKNHNTYIKSKKDRQKDLELVEKANTEKKEILLDELRLITNGEKEGGLKRIKEIQREWKEAEPSQSSNSRELWMNYKALLNIFYNNLDLQRQLKALDVKKNLELKLKLCERAEALDAEPSIREALKQLNVLHDEFKQIGPVPESDQESVWTRFKTATDKIYAKKRQSQAKFKEELDSNLGIKKQLIEDIKVWGTYTGENVGDWKKSTDSVLDLQKKWKKVGPVPRNLVKDLNKEFWSNSKAFFKNKSAFFESLGENSEENVAKKEQLCVAAEELLKSEDDPGSIADQFKDLQRRWKEAGPIPKEKNTELYGRFKQACDTFFEGRRANYEEENKAKEGNLAGRQKVIEDLEKAVSGKSHSIDELNKFCQAFVDAGDVPLKAVRETGKQFFDFAIKYALQLDDVTDDELAELKIDIKIVSLTYDQSAESVLVNDKKRLRREIGELESEVVTIETNMGFFASSKGASELKDEFEQKIDSFKTQIDKKKKLIKKLNQAF